VNQATPRDADEWLAIAAALQQFIDNSADKSDRNPKEQRYFDAAARVLERMNAAEIAEAHS
jgi:hypothetical protein